MYLPPRRLVIAVSAALTLGWSLLSLLLLYAAGMVMLRAMPGVVVEAVGPLVTAVTVVMIAAGAGIFSVAGYWLLGGPLLHAVEVWQADRLARYPVRAWPLPEPTDRWLRLAQTATVLLLPAALALLLLGR